MSRARVGLRPTDFGPACIGGLFAETPPSPLSRPIVSCAPKGLTELGRRLLRGCSRDLNQGLKLKQLIMNHVDEEENELSLQVEKGLEADSLNELGKQMKQRFDEVVEIGFEDAVPEGFGETSAEAARRIGRGRRGMGALM